MAVTAEFPQQRRRRLYRIRMQPSGFREGRHALFTKAAFMRVHSPHGWSYRVVQKDGFLMSKTIS